MHRAYIFDVTPCKESFLLLSDYLIAMYYNIKLKYINN